MFTFTFDVSQHLGIRIFVGAPELGNGRENKSGKTMMDKKFLEKVEAVRRYLIIYLML